MTGRRSWASKRVGLFAAATALTVLTACGGVNSRDPAVLEGMTAQQIFAEGEAQLENGRAEDAAFYFGEIERLYPYSDWARRALIMEAYAYHRSGDYENSRSTAQRYLDVFPGTEDAAYAQYLLALSYYDQIEEIGRDQGLTFQALQSLRAVIEQYPDSEYAETAKLKFDLAFDHLAAKEMEVGRYYLKQGNFAAAAGRFRVVVEDFQTTSHTAEALYRLIEAYLSLGLTDEAQTAGAILGYNYQSSTWYQEGYALLTGEGLEMRVTGENWLSAIYRQVVQGKWL